MYKNYIFDLYGTLIDIRTNEQKKYLWDKMAYVYSAMGATYTSTELKSEYFALCRAEVENEKKYKEYPEIKIEKVFGKLFSKKGVKSEEEQIVMIASVFRALSLQKLKLYDGVIDLLNELKKRKKKIFLLSNAQYVFTEPELRKVGIKEYFDGIVISSEEGVAKPAPEIFNTIINRYSLKKDESIMIGNDNCSDIMGAFKAGLDALYIKTETSPEYKNSVKAKYNIYDGDFRKINNMILLKQQKK